MDSYLKSHTRMPRFTKKHSTKEKELNGNFPKYFLGCFYQEDEKKSVSCDMASNLIWPLQRSWKKIT